MVHVIFFEKPSCINNTRQKKLLRESGHTVEAHDLLREDWQSRPEILRAFFADRPVEEWFNPSAPKIKNGTVIPADLDEQQVINLMTAEPMLIRRPLLQVGDERKAGFNEQEIDSWIGLKDIQAAAAGLEQCPKTSATECSHG